MCWLIPRLAGFRTLHPEIETRVIYAMHGRDIDFREIHVAFVYSATPPAHPGVENRPFLPGASVPVCSPVLVPRSAGPPLAPDEIRHLGLLHDTDTAGWRSWFGRAGHPASGPLPGPVFEDFNLLRSAALSGQGVALCPQAMIRPDIDAGNLVMLSPLPILTDHGYFLLTGPTPEAAMHDDAHVFRDWALASRDP
jgi:DNA-binding transcriptional LysR family regulator